MEEGGRGTPHAHMQGCMTTCRLHRPSPHPYTPPPPNHASSAPIPMQIRANVPRASATKTVEALQASNRWVDGPTLALHSQEKVREALSALAECEGGEGGGISTAVANKLLTGFLCALTSGTFLPPIRPSCVATMLIPMDEAAAASRQCMHPDCLYPDACSGNRLYWADDACMHLVATFAHHKTVSAARGGPITFELPPRVNEVAVLYLKHAHPILTASSDEAAARYVFVRPRGDPLTAESYADWWKRRVLGDKGWDISPQLCRHIFVTEVMEAIQDGRPAPDPEGAAEIMGNSVATWHSSYWVHSEYAKRRRGQQAVHDTARMYEADLLAPPPLTPKERAQLRAREAEERQARWATGLKEAGTRIRKRTMPKLGAALAKALAARALQQQLREAAGRTNQATAAAAAHAAAAQPAAAAAHAAAAQPDAAAPHAAAAQPAVAQPAAAAAEEDASEMAAWQLAMTVSGADIERLLGQAGM